MNKKNNRIYLSPPHMDGNEKKYMIEAFESNWIAPLGPEVDAFEHAIKQKTGAGGAAAMSSGTAAVHLALRYIGVGQGDIVFCSSSTFAATCNPILYQGAVPVFIDSEPDSWNMSPNALRRAFSDFYKEKKLPKAVVVVNLYGQSADMDVIVQICNEYNVVLIEDAAESLGAFYKGKPSGTFGKFGIYSFNGNKIITTSGGGMLISDDLEAIEKCRFWSTQARDKARHYQHSDFGYNYRMSNILAAIGRGQLENLDKKVEKKKEIYYRYMEAFSDINEIEMMPIPEWSKPNYWLTVITIDKESKVLSDEIMDALEEQNIETRPVWKPMHLQPLYQSCKYYSHYEDKSVSDDLFYRGICLPSGTSITEKELDRVIGVVRKKFFS